MLMTSMLLLWLVISFPISCLFCRILALANEDDTEGNLSTRSDGTQQKRGSTTLPLPEVS